MFLQCCDAHLTFLVYLYCLFELVVLNVQLQFLDRELGYLFQIDLLLLLVFFCSFGNTLGFLDANLLSLFHIFDCLLRSQFFYLGVLDLLDCGYACLC